MVRAGSISSSKYSTATGIQSALRIRTTTLPQTTAASGLGMQTTAISPSPGASPYSKSKSSAMRLSLTRSSLVKWLPIQEPPIIDDGTLMTRSTLGR